MAPINSKETYDTAGYANTPKRRYGSKSVSSIAGGGDGTPYSSQKRKSDANPASVTETAASAKKSSGTRRVTRFQINSPEKTDDSEKALIKNAKIREFDVSTGSQKGKLHMICFDDTDFSIVRNDNREEFNNTNVKDDNDYLDEHSKKMNENEELCDDYTTTPKKLKKGIKAITNTNNCHIFLLSYCIFHNYTQY